MDGWKILGCTAGGIVLMVSLPVLAPVGAVTSLGAFIGGGCGAMIGAIWGASDAPESEKAAKETEQHRDKAETDAQLSEIKKKQNDFIAEMSDEFAYFNLVTSLYEVGIASAAESDQLGPQILEEIKEFIGLAHE